MSNQKLLNGFHNTYYGDGTLKTEAVLKDGQLHGLYYAYWPNGKLKREAEFKDGEALGGTSFDEAGNKIEDQFIVDEMMPEFPGGIEKMKEFIGQHINYPTDWLGRRKEGTVVIQFIVTETGALDGFEVVRSVSRKNDQEAMRVVRLMPNWIPAYQKGKRVKVYFNLPIKFK